MKKLCLTVPFLLGFILYLRAISKSKLPAAYIRRVNLRRVSCVTSFGGLYMEGLIVGLLWYKVGSYGML